MKTLAGKTALVTGASRGIGKAIAKRLAHEGALTVIHYNENKKAAEDTLMEIHASGGKAFAVSADLSTMTGIENCWRQTNEILQSYSTGLDILVNNAGIGLVSFLHETTEQDFDRIFALNVKAPFFLLQKFHKDLREGGRVINLSSAVTRLAFPMVGTYSMSKGAINTMTLMLSKQLAERKITVNAVMPGFVNTDMNAAGLSDPQFRQYMESCSVFGRVGEPQDIADVVAFLASEDSRWITGQCIDVSGGTILG